LSPGDQSLPCRLLIAGRAVDLPGEKRPGIAATQRGDERARIDMIIFDRIAGCDDLARSSPGIDATIAACTSTGSEVEMPLG
jgi:hypothetical protein